MKSIRDKNHLKTEHIVIDSSLCKACWECVAICPNHVIGKIDFLFHKHSHINQGSKCKACLKCVKGCHYGAIQSLIQK